MKSVRGFTLVELMVVLAILSILAALSVPNYLEEINLKRANLAASETQSIVDAARAYRSKNGAWPGDSTCSNAIAVLRTDYLPYLPSSGATNKFSSLYSTSCTGTTFSLDQEALQDWDGYLVNSVASTQIVDSASHRIRTTIGVPGTEPALDAKLSRLASGNAELNRMRTTLLMGGNDISEVGTVNAISGRFSSDVQMRDLIVQQSATINGMLNAINGYFAGNVTSGTLSVQQNAAIQGALGVGGESQFNASARFGNDVVLQKRVAEGQGGCETGAIASDASGKTLSCQSGVWRSSGGGQDFVVTNCVQKDYQQCVPLCPAGYTLQSSSGVKGQNAAYWDDRYFAVGVCVRQ